MSSNGAVCDICQKKGTYRSAVVLCNECRQFFCSGCKENHELFSATEFHQYTPIQNEAPLTSKSFVFHTDKHNVGFPTRRVLEPIRPGKKAVQQLNNTDTSVYSMTIANDEVGIRTTTLFPQTVRKPLGLSRSKSFSETHKKDRSKMTDGSIVYSRTHAYDGMTIQASTATTQTDHKLSGLSRSKSFCETHKKDRSSNIQEDGLASTTKNSDFVEFTTKSSKSRKNPEANKRKVTKFYTKLDPDEDTPLITSLGCMSDGSIVLIDYRNKKLKLFWPTYDFHMAIEIREKRPPYGVTPVNEKKVAVTCGELIKFFTFKDLVIKQCQKTFELSLNGYGFGISHYFGKYAVVCNTLPKQNSYSSIRVLNKDGEQLQNINCNSLGSPSSLVQVTDNAVFYEEGILVLVKNERKLCCVGYNGECSWVRWERYVNGTPYGLCLAGNCALVACRGIEAYIQKVPLTQDGNLEEIVSEKDSIYSPKYVSFQNQAKKILVTEVGLGVVKVFLFEEGS